MMKGYSPTNLFLFSLLFLGVKGIEVTPDSTCSSLCVDQPGASTNISDYDSSHTSTGDLVCKDSEFKGSKTTPKGRKWVQCLNCEASSPAENPGYQGDNETDVFWFLFNLRFNLAWCVFGYDYNNETNPAMDNCGQACNNLLQPLTDQLFTVSESDRYAFCTSDNSAFTNDAPTCRACLEKVQDAQMMGNFVKGLEVACDQQPAMGKALDLGFNLFEVNSSSTTTSSTPTSSATATSTGNSTNAGTSSGVKIGVGVGVGCGGAIVLVGALFWFFWRKRHQHDDQPASTDQKPVSADKATGKDQIYEVADNAARPELGSDRRWEVQELSA